MTLPIYSTVIIDPDPGLSRRKRNNLLREGHREQGQAWLDLFMPLHWRADARDRYRHQARRPSYIRVKRARAGKGIVKRHGLVDNVYSGVMERLLRSSKTVQAYPTRATVKMHGPRYITMRPYKSGHPDKGKEISTVLPAERDVLQRVLQEKVNSGLAAMKAPKTTKIQ